MNITAFCYATGTPLNQIIENIPEEWNRVYSDRFTYVYRHKTVDAFALLVCDDDGVVRTCDVKQRDGERYDSIFVHTGLFENLTSYDAIRTDEDIMERLVKAHNTPFPTWFTFKRKLAVRRFYSRIASKPVYNSVPIRNNLGQWRTVADREAGDCCTDYIIIPDKWSDLWGTDREGEAWDAIEDFVFSTVGNKPRYDFPVGDFITLSWGFTRTPSGIAIKHCRGLDW